MKRSDELRIQKTQKVERMQAILDGAKKDNSRDLNETEQTEWDNLDKEVRSMTTQIQRAERMEFLTPSNRRGKSNRQEADDDDPEADDDDAEADDDAAQHQRGGLGPQIMKRASKVYNVARAIRGFVNEKMDGLEAETQTELKRSIGITTPKTALLIPTTPLYRDEIQNGFRRANENTTTTHAAVNDVFVQPDISIFGKEPMYQLMGCTILDGVQGSLKLSKKTPSIGEQVAETVALSNNADDPSTSATLSPKRYGAKDVWTAEQLAQENPAIHAKLLADLVKAADRKIAGNVYTKILAGATAVAAASTLTEAGMNLLMNQVDGAGAFLMSRTTFFSAKSVVFDAGSGLRLFSKMKGAVDGLGESWEGIQAFYSSLFTDAANTKFVTYGDMSEFYIARWGALEVVFDPYTLAENGYTKVIVNRLADMAVRNDAAFSKTADLDPA